MQEEKLNPRIITPIRAIDDNKDTLARAVGYAEPIDWSQALERMEKAKQK